MPLKWEFPGGKIEPGEQPREALRRELQEELGVSAQIGDEVETVQYHYKNGGAVELHFFRVAEFDGEMEKHIFEQIRWVEPRSLTRFDFLDADREIVRKIAAGDVL